MRIRIVTGAAIVGLALALSAHGIGAQVPAPAQSKPDTSVTLFDQGLVQVLQAAVTGLAPKRTYRLAFATRPDGTARSSH